LEGHDVRMRAEEIVEAVGGFVTQLAASHPELVDDLRRIEVDLDEVAVVRIVTDVGAGWAALR
jgi:hypothetical protein